MILELIIPFLDILPLIERLILNVGALLSLEHFISHLVIVSYVVLILILVFLLSLACQENSIVVHGSHADAEVIIDREVAVEVTVGEFNIYNSILEFTA